MFTKERRCPIPVESKGQVVKTHLLASDAEQPAEIAIRVREEGWKPFRVRFDDSNSVWVVSTLEYTDRVGRSAPTIAPQTGDPLSMETRTDGIVDSLK